MEIEYLSQTEKKLKEILKEDLDISSRLLTELVRHHLIKVDGKNMNINSFVNKGSTVKINFDYETNTYEPSDMDIKVIYEDDMILVVNKESGIVVHPTNGVKSGTLLNAISNYQKKNNQNYKIRFVNRLDMGTSGVVVVAKNKYSMNKYSKELSNRRVIKEYLAVVDGVLDHKVTVDKPLKKELDSPRRTFSTDGKSAVTHFTPLKNNGIYTLVKAVPLTGRTHQIRSHLAYISHAILGDELYGGLQHNRLMLHCSRMVFTELGLDFEVEASEEFNRYWEV